jgi:hypothetical protein
MGVYIRTLIDISRTAAGYQLGLKEFDIAEYMEQIEAQANSLCLTKEISDFPYFANRTHKHDILFVCSFFQKKRWPEITIPKPPLSCFTTAEQFFIRA